MDAASLLPRPPSPPPLLRPPPPPPSSSPVATALLRRPPPSPPSSSSVRPQPPPPTSPENTMAVPCLRHTTTGHISLTTPPSSLVVGRNPWSLRIEQKKALGSSSSRREMEKTPSATANKPAASRDEEEEEEEIWEMHVGMHRDFRRPAALRHAARAAPRRLPAARIPAPVHSSHRGNAGDKGMVAQPRRPRSARAPSFSRRKESQRGLSTGNKFQPLACMTEDMVDLILSPHRKQLAVRERIQRGKGGEAFSVETSEDYDGSASDKSDEDNCSSVGIILIGQVEVKFNLAQYEWPEVERKQGKAKDATHRAAPLPMLETNLGKEAALAAPVLDTNHGKEAALPVLDTTKEATHMAAPLPMLETNHGKGSALAAPVLDTKHGKEAALPLLDTTKEAKHVAAALPLLDTTKEAKHIAAPLPVLDTNHRKEAAPLAMLKAYGRTQAGHSSAAREPARNPLAVDIGPVPAAGGGGGLGRGGGGGGPGGGGGGGGGPGEGGGSGGGPGGGGGGGGGGGPGGGGGGGGGGGHGNVPGLRVLPNQLPHALCNCRDPATRYCRGCQQIFCPFCFCNCNAVNHFLPLPSLVGGSCVLNQPVTLTAALYPMIFVRGVRQEPWLYWQFATAGDIFQVEDVQPTIDLLVYGFRMQGQWVVQMPEPVHVDVLRAAVFPDHYH